ncbi:branched-chain-amino-acid aminotransferase [Cichlidogyrus casuarinus]|uniref:Branched-chain-amino-acid aminotransferase n=1 Tax=Cichlidogyrus casuarinus TaxID=1844966 RepID=A0ABD2QBY2_9PLAT
MRFQFPQAFISTGEILLFSRRQYRTTFSFKDLVIRETTKRGVKPTVEQLQFGKFYTDHMLYATWTLESGWDELVIKPVEPFSVHPGNRTFHYSSSCFEGAKVMRGVDNVIRIFRFEENIKRLNKSTTRLCLPNVDLVECIKSVKRLIQLDQDWVPSGPNTALYVRPAMIATDSFLGVHAPTAAAFFVLLCPVGYYYANGPKPVSLLADPQFVRSWPGGTGDTKIAANYASTPFVQQIAQNHDCQQTLWLYGPDEQVTEVGTMNFFIALKELVTAPLDGLILPGVTRASVLELATSWGDIKVSERVITMPEIIKAQKEDRVIEAFGTGTACVISQVEGFRYRGDRIQIPVGDMNSPSSITGRIYKELSDIQYGRVTPHPWTSCIEDIE